MSCDFSMEAEKRVYVRCEYKDIDKIKESGNCRFSKEYKLWYFLEEPETEVLDTYKGFEVVENPMPYVAPKKYHVTVSYKNKDIAKNDGLKFDRTKKQWYIEATHKNFQKIFDKYYLDTYE